MGKIFSYSSIGTPAGDDPVFIGDYSTDNANPEIKYATTDNLFKRDTIWAKDVNGLSLKDDGGTLSLIIADGGNIGVGTTDVESWDSNYRVFQFGVGAIAGHLTSSSLDFYNNAYWNGSNTKYRKTGAASVIQLNSSGEMYFAVTASGTIDTNITWSYALAIDNSARVGVQTTTPSFPLDVNGQAQIGAGDDKTPDSAGDGHLMINGSGYVGFFSLDGSAGWLGHNSASRSLYLATDETARLTITGAGLVGIGTTSPSVTFHTVRASSGMVARLENTSVTNSILEFKNSTPTTYYIVGGPSNLILGNATTAGATTVNISTNGNTHIGGADASFKLQVTSTSYQAARINSNATAGGAISILSDKTNPANLLLSFSRTVNSTANVNWMAGNFYSSASYFGIHYKNADLKDTNAKFDTSTIANNLFYINTSGDTYMRGGVNTHTPAASTGHNTGRFVQCFDTIVTLYDGKIVTYVAPLGPPNVPATTLGSGSSTVYPVAVGAKRLVFSEHATMGTKLSLGIHSLAPYDGKLIKLKMTPSATFAESVKLGFYTGASAVDLSPSAGDVTVTSYTYATIANTSLVADTVLTVNASDFTSDSGLSFSEDDFLSFFIEPAGTSAGADAFLRISSVFEFQIT